jgi:hypothetical protein
MACGALLQVRDDAPHKSDASFDGCHVSKGRGGAASFVSRAYRPLAVALYISRSRTRSF